MTLHDTTRPVVPPKPVYLIASQPYLWDGIVEAWSRRYENLALPTAGFSEPITFIDTTYIPPGTYIVDFANMTVSPADGY